MSNAIRKHAVLLGIVLSLVAKNSFAAGPGSAPPLTESLSQVIQVFEYRNCTLWCGAVRDSRTGERVSPERAERFMHDERMGRNYLYRGDGSVSRIPGDRSYQREIERGRGYEGGGYWRNSAPGVQSETNTPKVLPLPIGGSVNESPNAVEAEEANIAS